MPGPMGGQGRPGLNTQAKAKNFFYTFRYKNAQIPLTKEFLCDIINSAAWNGLDK